MIPLFKSRVAVFAIGILLVGVSVVSAQVWTPPTANFPAGNVSVPLTTGSSTQWKNGTLYVNQLRISPTSTATFNAMTFPLNKGVGGFSGTSQRTVFYPYAGPSWGVYLQSYTAGGGLITLVSGENMNNPAQSSFLQLRPDGRIVTRGVLVLPNTATTSVSAGARVPGALVYFGGTAYMYNGSSWNPVGSGGGGGAGWTLAGTVANPLLYTTSQTANVGVGTMNPTAALEIRGDTRIDKTLYSSVWNTGWKYRVLGYISGASNIACNATAYTAWSSDSELSGIIVPGGNFSQYQITTDRTGGPTTPPTNGTRLCNDSDVTTPQCDLPPDGAWDADSTAPLRVYDFYVDHKLGGVCSPGIVEFVREPALQEGGNLLVTGSASAGKFCLGGQCISDWTSGGVWVAGSAGSISYSGGNVGIGTNNPTSRLSIDAPTDDAIKLMRTGAATPVLFKTGGDGALVINTFATDTVYIKDGRVGIKAEFPTDELTVQGGFSVNRDSTSATVYDYTFALSELGHITEYPFGTPRNACLCDPDPNGIKSASEAEGCPTPTMQQSVAAQACYDHWVSPSNGLQYTHWFESTVWPGPSPVFKGGYANFDGYVSVGAAVAGYKPYVQFISTDGNYQIKNHSGSLQFNNDANQTRLTLGQDGALNVNGPNFNVSSSGLVRMGTATPSPIFPSARLTINGAVVITGPSSGPGLAGLYVGTSSAGFVQTRDLIANRNTITTNLTVRASSTGSPKGLMVSPVGGGPSVQGYIITGGSGDCPGSKWGNAICSGYNVTCPGGFTARKIGTGAYNNICTYP